MSSLTPAQRARVLADLTAWGAAPPGALAQWSDDALRVQWYAHRDAQRQREDADEERRLLEARPADA